MKIKFLGIIFSVAFSLILGSGEALAKDKAPIILKCQDKDGKWHYGKANFYRCDKSNNMTVMTDNGVKVGVYPPVKTEEELVADKRNNEILEAELEKERQERIEKQRIMMVYQSEGDINADRGKKLKALEQKKKQHEQYVFSLKKQNEQFDRKKANTTNFAIKDSIEVKKGVVSKKIKKSTKKIESLEVEISKLNKEFDDIIAYFRKQNN